METLFADIKYRGIFTNRGIRFIAMLAMTLSQIAAIVSLTLKAAVMLIPAMENAVPTTLINILISLGYITFPLLLISAFSSIFASHESILKGLIVNFALALITFIFSAFFLYGIIVGIIERLPTGIDILVNVENVLKILKENPQLYEIIPGLTGNPELSVETIRGILESVDAAGLNQMISSYLPQISGVAAKFIIVNYVNINVFFDLFLCTLSYFFISYRPKKLAGGKLMVFRSCAVLPVLYVFGSTFLLGLLKTGIITMPIWCMALLTNRNLSYYVLFFLIVLFMKYNEQEILHKGHSYDSFLIYMKTKKASLYFSIYTCICMIGVCLIDYGLSFMETLAIWGMGKSYKMFFAIPIIMLFSFNKKPKHKWTKALIPVYYIFSYALVIFLVLVLIGTIPYLLDYAANNYDVLVDGLVP